MMTEEEHEQLLMKAKTNVCSCWFYEINDETDEESLRAVISNSQALHYLNQIHNPVPADEFEEELRECPSYPGGAG